MSVYQIQDEQGHVINTIVADAAFVQAAYPGRYRLLAEPMREVGANDGCHTRMTPLAFRNRFTDSEKAAIELACVIDPEASEAKRQQAAKLLSFRKDLEAASYVCLNDPRTVAGVLMLEVIGVLTNGRSKVILETPIADSET